MDALLGSSLFNRTLTAQVDVAALLTMTIVGVVLSIMTHYLFYGRLRSLHREFAIVVGGLVGVIGWFGNGLLGMLQLVFGAAGADQHWPSYIFWACIGVGLMLGMAGGYRVHARLFHGHTLRVRGRVVVRLPDWRKDSLDGYR